MQYVNDTLSLLTLVYDDKMGDEPGLSLNLTINSYTALQSPSMGRMGVVCSRSKLVVDTVITPYRIEFIEC